MSKGSGGSKGNSWRDNNTSRVLNHTTKVNPNDIPAMDRYFSNLNASKINKVLRSSSQPSFEDRETIDALDRNMKPIDRNMTVQRLSNGVYLKSLGIDESNLSDKSLSSIVGKTVSDKGYLSTSYTERPQPYYATTRVKMILDVPKGTKGIFSYKTGSADEKEFLIHRNSSYKITRAYKGNDENDVYIHAIIVK